MNPLHYVILGYLALISIISIIVTIADKAAAKAKRRRVPEKTLLLLGLFGGAAAMFITMVIIRHKTKHAKFMIPLPLFAVVHIVAIVLAFMYL